MNKTTDKIQRNNQLREQLTPANKKYYEDLLTYLRLRSLFKDEAELEDLLLDLLTDVLTAQSDNLSAVEYLGKEPEVLGDEILANLSGNSWRKTLLFALQGIGIYLVFASVGLIASASSRGVVLGHIFLNCLVVAAGIVAVLYLLARSVYHALPKIIVALPFALAFGLFIVIPLVVPPFWVIILTPKMTLSLLVIIFIAALGITVKSGSFEFIPPLIVMALLGGAQQFYLGQQWVTSHAVIVVVALVVSVALSFFLGYRRLKK